MKKSIIFILLSTMVINSQAMQPDQKQAVAAALLCSLCNKPDAKQALNLGLTAGSIGTATGISAGIITCKLLNKLPVISNFLIGKLCIIGISGAVGLKVGRAATHQSLIELIKRGQHTPESDTEETANR